MATFTPAIATGVSGVRDPRRPKHVNRWYLGDFSRATNVFLYDDDTLVIENAFPPASYDSDGDLVETGLERLTASFYGARGAYTVTATQSATLTAAGYTVDA